MASEPIILLLKSLLIFRLGTFGIFSERNHEIPSIKTKFRRSCLDYWGGYMATTLLQSELFTILCHTAHSKDLPVPQFGCLTLFLLWQTHGRSHQEDPFYGMSA